MLSLLPTAMAADSLGNGSLSVLATADGPETRFVVCEFFVRGEDLVRGSGTINAVKDFDPVLASWDGVPEGDGEFSFLLGPFRLPESGHWVISAPFTGSDDGPADVSIRYTACDDDVGAPAGCVDTLLAETREQGDVFLDWESDRDGASYDVLRDGAVLAHTSETSFLDTTSEPGVTYTYEVRTDGVSCGTAQVTAVPFFPGLVLGGLAMVGACGAYAALRRR